ncbi:MAG: hypothetical protein U0940_02270, partial [Nitrospirota bacterium]|nr:hypothetical protein [Nitrospirota bacterium]
MSRIPEGMRAIVCSRKDPPPVFTRLRANHLIEIIGWDELRLALEESRGIIRLRAPQVRSKETIRRLHETAEGWAAGLVLMLQRMKREGTDPQILGRLSQEGVFDYFKSELFDKTEKKIQDFLLKTAFLPRITPRMAHDLTGLSGAARILAGLNRDNYFTEKRFNTETFYQYHPLLREFLLSCAREIFPPETLSALHHCAAILLEESGQVEDALRLFRENSEQDAVVSLIMKHAQALLAQGRNRTLEEWLALLPEGMIEDNPWLSYWRGASRLPYDPLQSHPAFEKAFEGFTAREDVAGIFLAWSGIVDSINYGFTDFAPMDHWVSVLDGLMQSFRAFPSSEIEAQVASSMVAALALRELKHPDIESWADRILSLPEDHSAVICSKIKTLLHLICHRRCTGDLRKIASDIGLLRHLRHSREASPLARLTAKFAEACGYEM